MPKVPTSTAAAARRARAAERRARESIDPLVRAAQHTEDARRALARADALMARWREEDGDER